MTKRTIWTCVRIGAVAAVAAATLWVGPVMLAEEQRPEPVTQASVPTRLDVTLTRTLGERLISSSPFVLMATAADANRANSPLVEIRMGMDVPIGSTTSNIRRTTGAQTNNTTSTATARMAPEYRDVGTNINARVQRIDETQFSVNVTVQDSSAPGTIDTGVVGRVSESTVFRSFSTNNTLLMRDGQTQLFGVATDKLTGETLKIEVKLTVLR